MVDMMVKECFGQDTAATREGSGKDGSGRGRGGRRSGIRLLRRKSNKLRDWDNAESGTAGRCAIWQAVSMRR